MLIPTPTAAFLLLLFLPALTSTGRRRRHSVWQARAEPQLVVVDDEDGDAVTGLKPTYATQNASVAWNQGATCTICAIKLDTDQVEDGTYHDITTGGTYYPEADFEFSFTGYEVNVYFVLAGDNLADDIVVDTTVDILMDDVLVSSFAHDASQFSDYQYNQTIYANTSMANTNHTITIRTAGNEQSVILFDYLTYVKDDDTVVLPGASSTGTATATTSQTTAQGQTQTGVSTSSQVLHSASHSKTSAGAIAGGVVGGVCSLLAIGGLLLLYLRRRKSSTAKASDTTLIHPFDAQQSQTQGRPDSSAVLTPVTDVSLYPARKSPLDTSLSPVIAMPYSMKRPLPGTYTQQAAGLGDSDQPERAQGTQMQEQVQYLLAEVDRLRMRADQSQSQSQGRGSSSRTHTSNGGDRASLVVESSQPPEYTKDARMAPCA